MPKAKDNPTRYCIQERATKGYVKSLVFSDCGVHIDFTKEVNHAASVSIREVVEHLAHCVPGGTVRVWESITS